MPIGRAIMGVFLGSVLASPCPGAEGPRPFAVPKSKAEWTSRRAALDREILSSLPGGLNPAGGGSLVTSLVEVIDDDIRVESLKVESGRDRPVVGLFAWKSGGTPTPRPIVLYLANRGDSARLLGPGISAADGGAGRAGGDPRPVLVELARRGLFAVWVEADTSPDDPTNPDRWSEIFRGDRAALASLANRPEVDFRRVGVLGVGLGARRAAWLMALMPHIKSGVLFGGMARLADRTGHRPESPASQWMTRLADGRDLDAIVALCAGPGRTLEWTVGDRDPTGAEAAVAPVEAAGKAMDKLVGDGHSFHITRLGRHDGNYGRLQWLAATEIFDKAFFPQGPTPLGHPPEPEPPVTPEFVDLAAHGLAGWSVEMSQRPTTWTWRDGVIACKPGPDEYGWLRAPIEVGDFILSVEWKVPPGGNSGIFLRGRPVPWTFPPSGTYKRVVSSLGLDWPSRTGLELQAQDDSAYYGGRVGAADKFSSGSLYRHAAPSENPTRPPGQWNTYTVRARGPRVEVWSNGKQVLDTEIDRHPLTLAIPPLRGYIGLQNHGAPAEFRNVKLLRLGP